MSAAWVVVGMILGFSLGYLVGVLHGMSAVRERRKEAGR